MQKELQSILNNMKEVKAAIDSLKQYRYDLFMTCFTTINCKLKETYQALTQGGDAEL